MSCNYFLGEILDLCRDLGSGPFYPKCHSNHRAITIWFLLWSEVSKNMISPKRNTLKPKWPLQTHNCWNQFWCTLPVSHHSNPKVRLAPCLARTEAFRVELTATGWKTTSHILKLLPQGFQWPHPRLHRAEWNGFLYALQTKNPKQMVGETTIVEQIFIFGVASPYDPLWFPYVYIYIIREVGLEGVQVGWNIFCSNKSEQPKTHGVNPVTTRITRYVLPATSSLQVLRLNIGREICLKFAWSFCSARFREGHFEDFEGIIPNKQIWALEKG